MKGWFAMMPGAFPAGSSFGYDERPVVPADTAVQVRFQIRSGNSKSRTTGTATRKGAVSESMMANEISRRYPHSAVRILSAGYGRNVQTSVRYQISRDGRSWSGSTAALTNALTESMARNQLSQKFPNMQERILGLGNH